MRSSAAPENKFSNDVTKLKQTKSFLGPKIPIIFRVLKYGFVHFFLLSGIIAANAGTPQSEPPTLVPLTLIPLTQNPLKLSEPTIQLPKAPSLIDVVRTSSGEILLQSSSCDGLIDEANNILNWTQSLGEQTGKIGDLISRPEDGNCSISVTQIAPSFVRLLQGAHAKVNGPNCWNTSLKFTGLVEYQRFSHADEMTFWMQSPFCKELNTNDILRAGDLIAIRRTSSSPVTNEVHGMIYVSDDLVFSKNTSGVSSTFGLQRANLVFQAFRLTDSSCLRIKGSSPNCSIWANFYRCESALGIRNQLAIQNPIFGALSFNIHNMESTIANSVSSGAHFTPENLALYRQQISTLESQIQGFKTANSNEIYFVQSFAKVLFSLNAQLRFFEKKNDAIVK